jgi:DNA replication protein DnaC
MRYSQPARKVRDWGRHDAICSQSHRHLTLQLWWEEYHQNHPLARADGSLSSFLARLAKIDVLVVDDWVNSPLAETERRDFLEICEDRYQLRSTILTSQIPVKRWHEQIGDPTLADSILDRLVHNAHQIELQGKSARKELHGKDGKGS